MSEETRETTRLRTVRPATKPGYPVDISDLKLEHSRKPKRRRAVEPRRAKGMWVPTWLFWLWWVLVLLPSALLVYESVVGW